MSPTFRHCLSCVNVQLRDSELADPTLSSSWSRCLISKAEVQSFIERCMVAVGTQPHHARSLAEVLVEGDHRGHYSHGLNRMGGSRNSNLEPF